MSPLLLIYIYLSASKPASELSHLTGTAFSDALIRMQALNELIKSSACWNALCFHWSTALPALRLTSIGGLERGYAQEDFRF